ncbi:MAG TPA: hypothetical protein VIC27_04645 [Ktedonobacterales bacterium]|jgi:hypothetical protein
MTTTHISQTRERDTPTAPERGFFARLPAYTWFGLALNLFAWTSSWARLGFWWPYTFFPLWLGFILMLDGLNVAVSGTSPLKRSTGRFVALFLFSSPFWWVFEGLNIPVQNWHYHYDHVYSPLSNFFWTSLDFSTVLPAVMELVELVAAIPGLRPRLAPDKIGRRLPLGAAFALIGLGVVTLALPFVFPRQAFGMVWLCLIFLLDPITNLAGFKSASAHLLARDWRFFVTVPLATIVCGFFWEMWNSQASPGWSYVVPYINARPYLFGGPIPHLFEMPLLGYLGYLPFGIELFVMYQFSLMILRMRRDNLAV